MAQVTVHPDYATTASGLAVHDLMLVKLARPAVLSSWVRPLCLPAPAPALLDPALVTAVGWGVTETEVLDTPNIDINVLYIVHRNIDTHNFLKRWLLD